MSRRLSFPHPSPGGSPENRCPRHQVLCASSKTKEPSPVMDDGSSLGITPGELQGLHL